jgi:hypothetical protein
VTEPIEQTYVRIFDAIKDTIINGQGDATSKLELRIEAARIARDLTFGERSEEEE